MTEDAARAKAALDCNFELAKAPKRRKKPSAMTVMLLLLSCFVVVDDEIRFEFLNDSKLRM